MQRALERHDRAALAGFARRQGDISLSIRAAGQAPPPAPAGAIRSVVVSGPSGPLGSVDAVEHLSALLHQIAVRTNTGLRFSNVGGPPGQPYSLTTGGRRYRAMHLLLGTGVGLLAFVPQHEIDAAVHRRRAAHARQRRRSPWSRSRSSSCSCFRAAGPRSGVSPAGEGSGARSRSSVRWSPPRTTLTRSCR